jgi:arginine/lysine/ornithine decarboxylase
MGVAGHKQRQDLVGAVVAGDAPLYGAWTPSSTAIERHRAPPRHSVTAAAWTLTPQPVLWPRKAFFAHMETVSADAAAGRVSAELIAPYPPGVPMLAPGELISGAALDALREVQADGGGDRLRRRSLPRHLSGRLPVRAGISASIRS